MTNPTLLPVQSYSTTGNSYPVNTVVVCSPSHWANPFEPGVPFTDMAVLSTLAVSRFEWHEWATAEAMTPRNHAEALEMYRRYVLTNPNLDLEELRGHNLACTCPIGKPCHRDVLLILANK